MNLSGSLTLCALQCNRALLSIKVGINVIELSVLFASYDSLVGVLFVTVMHLVQNKVQIIPKRQ